MDVEGGHGGLQEDEDCKCETLPNGEKICDPWQCDQGNVNSCKVLESSSAYLPMVTVYRSSTAKSFVNLGAFIFVQLL